MTDSEIRIWISIPYLPPPLRSLQARGLKADQSYHPPLEVDWEGVEEVGERRVSKFRHPLRTVEPTSWIYHISWTHGGDLRIYSALWRQLS